MRSLTIAGQDIGTRVSFLKLISDLPEAQMLRGPRGSKIQLIRTMTLAPEIEVGCFWKPGQPERPISVE